MKIASLRIGPPQQFHNAATRLRSFPSATLFLRTVFCVASVVLGFRISQQTSQTVLHFHRHPEHFQHRSSPDNPNPAFSSAYLVAPAETTVEATRLPHPDMMRLPSAPAAGNTTRADVDVDAAGVQVGRHQIWIRKWPHPDPTETMKAYSLLARVQQEQELWRGGRDWRPIIAITPTFSRMLQALHLTGLLHTLSLVRRPVTWIVIEAGGVSNGTAELLAQARVHKVVHLGYPRPMPVAFEARWVLESHLRVEGLRFVREKHLEGVVVFADDNNGYSLKFFDVAQKVNWVGLVPMGILGYAGYDDQVDVSRNSRRRRRRRRGSLLFGILRKGQAAPKVALQVQSLVPEPRGGGWHAHRPLPLDWDSGKGTALIDNKLQWAGFVLDARAVWASSVRPHWLHDWKVWTRGKEGVYLDFRSIFKDESQAELLLLPDWGRHQVRHWWIRMEARHDGKFPLRFPVSITRSCDSNTIHYLPATRTVSTLHNLLFLERALRAVTLTAAMPISQPEIEPSPAYDTFYLGTVETVDDDHL